MQIKDKMAFTFRENVDVFYYIHWKEALTLWGGGGVYYVTF